MIHTDTALNRLQERFVDREFSVRDASDALPFTHGTTLVALSILTKKGLLVRKRKGVYSIKGLRRDVAVKELRRPEIRLERGYATGTYALSAQLSPVSPSRYIDLVVPLEDYPAAVEANEISGTFPEPHVYPSGRDASPLKELIDGLKVPVPEVAFVDLVKIAVERKRPVSLEYEIVPFIPQLFDRWERVRTLAEEEGVADYLEAILFYVATIAQKSGCEVVLPASNLHKTDRVKTLTFTAGRADEASVETGKETGIVVEGDQNAVRGVLSNL
jgi:hypothetical protein